MTIRKVFQNKSTGTILVSIPVEFVRSIGLTKEDNVNITLSGNTLHITKVLLQ